MWLEAESCFSRVHWRHQEHQATQLWNPCDEGRSSLLHLGWRELFSTLPWKYGAALWCRRALVYVWAASAPQNFSTSDPLQDNGILAPGYHCFLLNGQATLLHTLHLAAWARLVRLHEQHLWPAWAIAVGGWGVGAGEQPRGTAQGSVW